MRLVGAIFAALLAASCVEQNRGGPGPPAQRRPSAQASTGTRLELLLRIQGEAKNGELGFRFGPPRDLNGDGIAEIAAGARFTALKSPEMGTVGVWSSAGGKELARWEGDADGGLFGQSVLLGPDVDGDGRPDLIASAPMGRHGEVQRGVVYARSPLGGSLLWRAAGEPGQALGWQLAPAGDQNRDGTEDLFAGAPGDGAKGWVYLLDGRSGAVLRAIPSPDAEDQFGWYVCAAPDFDGDSLDDLLVGAPSARRGGSPGVGAGYLISSATGRQLHAWYGRQAWAFCGEMVVALPDLDGDGAAEVAVSSTFHPNFNRDESLVGEVAVYSGRSGKEIRRFQGREHIELYGRGVAPAGDLDGDGVGDIAIGAPWFRAAAGEKAGRFEVRSGKTGEVLLGREGDRAEMWLGWHIAAGEDLGAARERGLVVSAIRSGEGGLAGAGAILVYVVRG